MRNSCHNPIYLGRKPGMNQLLVSPRATRGQYNLLPRGKLEGWISGSCQAKLQGLCPGPCQTVTLCLNHLQSKAAAEGSGASTLPSSLSDFAVYVHTSGSLSLVSLRKAFVCICATTANGHRDPGQGRQRSLEIDTPCAGQDN